MRLLIMSYGSQVKIVLDYFSIRADNVLLDFTLMLSGEL
jgi:hypothetical protein